MNYYRFNQPTFNKFVPHNPHYGTISLDKKAAMLRAVRRNRVSLEEKEIAKENWKRVINDFIISLTSEFDPIYAVVHFPELLTLDYEWNKEALFLMLFDAKTFHEFKELLSKKLASNKEALDTYLIQNNLDFNSKTRKEWIKELNLEQPILIINAEHTTSKG